MASFSPSATAESIQALRDTAIPALNLAKAGVTGIGIPGLEGAINGVFDLAKMVSTMKGNKQDLAALITSVNAWAALKVPGATGDLKARLTELSLKMTVRLEELDGINRFLRSNEYSKKILDLRNEVADDIFEFTFYGNISIETLLKNVEQKVLQGTTQIVAGGTGGNGGNAVNHGVGGSGGLGEGPRVMNGVVQTQIILDSTGQVLTSNNQVFSDNILQRLKCSAARYNADNTPKKCMDGTRTDVIKDILGKLTALPDIGQRLVILSGSAGSGKSTIAKSIASILAEKHNLAASFFFSRDFAERNNEKNLPSTLARQLADFSGPYRKLLVKFLDEDCKGVLSTDPKSQFKALVVELLAKIPSVETPWIICLDALDECGLDRGQQCLRWLSDSINEIPKHIKFFLTGRPDVPQYLKFDNLHSLAHEIVLDNVDPSQVNHDIHLYVEKSLDGMTWTPREFWKAQAQDVDEITKRAGGLFIFAATAVRYVSEFPREDPQNSIEYLLRGAPLIHLHDLYSRVVGDAIMIPPPDDNRARDSRDRATRVLSTIIQLQEPLSPVALASLLNMETKYLIRTLLPLSAVIYLPDTTDSGQIRIIHLSFRDFMISNIQKTRPDLLCGTDTQQDAIVSDIFRVLHNELRFNICDLPTSYLENFQIPNIKRRIQTYIPEHLQYACRFWADHLCSVSSKPDRAEDAETFLLNQFLFWLEIMSLLGLVGDAHHELSEFILWANKDSPATQFAVDAKRFMAFFAEPIIQSTPHIYLSALALAPTMSEITKRFRSQFKFLVSITRGQMTRWPAMVHAMEHGSAVISVAFSPNGKNIVSGSDNGTVQLWDAETGEVLRNPFEGHTNVIHSVAFSPDGKKIVSGSSDKTVRLWDVDTGEALGDPLEGHTDWVWSVAFSPDGKKIVSGSMDETVLLWDAATGEPLFDPFEGHTGDVQSVAFSPDGKKIVSGSLDETVQLWDADTGEALGDPLEGHTNIVQSVAFSPDGKKIVSGSSDETVRLWDAVTGEALCNPIEGHTYIVQSVAFSPDGKKIVSGSHDYTARLWDTDTGEALNNVFEGHTNMVHSVVFSPDGKKIVSGSSDDTVRLWDADTGEPLSDPFEGHTDSVWSVSFSPDGKKIVSGSEDKTVRLWDSGTGEPLINPIKGHTKSVRVVLFSPDGKKIVSGSGDKTVRLWDADTGEAIGDPFRGHTKSVWSVAFSHDGKKILSGSEDKTVRLWDADTGEPLSNLFIGQTRSVHVVAFSPDGKKIVSYSRDNTVRLWDADTGEPLSNSFEAHSESVECLAISSDGKKIVSGSIDKTVRLWDADTGKMLGDPFEGHTEPVQSVAFSPDGKTIVSCSYDKTIRLWDAGTGDVLDDPSDSSTHPHPPGSGSISSESHFTTPIQYIMAGWASSSSDNLLLWLPATNRDGVWTKHTKLIVGRKQTQVSFENSVHGTGWKNCYVGQ